MAVNGLSYNRDAYLSILDPLLRHVETDPDCRALVFIGNDDSETDVSRRQLRDEAYARAALLRERGVDPGDLVILSLGHSLELLYCFWGAVSLGAVPSIFPYVSPMIDRSSYQEHLRALVSGSGARAVVVGPDDAALETPGDGGGTTELIRMAAPAGGAAGFLPHCPDDSEETTYIQYTSGSTGLQKGVMLSHRAILNYVPTFITAVGFRPGDVVVNWLPLYHDYGLFAGFIMPILSGLETVLISPFKWVRNPLTLLRAIDKYRGSCCWMPNFGMNHSVQHVPERRLDDLDLSSLRVFASGGEPVRRESQQMFYEKFARCGFTEDALMTGYGMAENTLQLSVTRPGKRAPVDWTDIKALQREKVARPAEAGAPGATSIVSCGVLCDGVEGRIVDEEDRDLPERGVGELLIRTGTLFSGYHRRPDLTAQVMTDGWYRTGDIAYMADENVYVCGRKKDLIIVGGRNVYPEDLESVTAGISCLLPGKVVAFGVPDEELGSEKVILACEIKGDPPEEEKKNAVKEIRRRVKLDMDVVLGDVLLVPKGWVVFTRNRKKSRSGSRAKYLEETEA